MNPSDYFKEGSTSYVQTKQALDVINAAREAGLPEAEQYQKDLESSISLAKQSGWRDFSGFDATRKAVFGLVPKVEAVSQAKITQPQEVAKKEATSAAAIANINSMINRSTKSGNQVDPELIASVINLAPYDPNKAMEIAKSSFPVLEQKPEEKAPKKTAADITFEQNASAALRFTNQLTDAIQKYGTFELASPEGAAKLGQLPYQMAIAYAKTVDPSSVAREGEVAAAQKYLIPMGIGTRNATALAAAKDFKKDIEERVSQYKKSTGSDITIGEVDKKSESPEETVGGANTFFDKFK